MNKGPRNKGPFVIDAGVVKMVNRMFSMIFQQKAVRPQPEPRYRACSSLDMTWDFDEIQQVVAMLQAGECMGKISRLLQRREEEIQILLIDLNMTMNRSEKLQ